MPAPKRAEMLFRAAQILVERKETFARDMTREMGKVLNETRGDVQEAIDMTFYMAGEGRRMFGQTVPSELRNKFAMSVRQPLGVCVDHHAVELPDGDSRRGRSSRRWSAATPSCSSRRRRRRCRRVNFVKVLEEAGIPKGVVNLVTGDGDEVGTPLTTHDGRPRGVVHRLDARRPHRQPGGGAGVQEGPPRDGRQERHHDHG